MMDKRDRQITLFIPFFFPQLFPNAMPSAGAAQDIALSYTLSLSPTPLVDLVDYSRMWYHSPGLPGKSV